MPIKNAGEVPDVSHDNGEDADSGDQDNCHQQLPGDNPVLCNSRDDDNQEKDILSFHGSLLL
ncbi:MAG: hypothetical protein WCF90_05075 [Methanomicrobiales archaeon]